MNYSVVKIYLQKLKSKTKHRIVFKEYHKWFKMKQMCFTAFLILYKFLIVIFVEFLDCKWVFVSSVARAESFTHISLVEKQWWVIEASPYYECYTRVHSRARQRVHHHHRHRRPCDQQQCCGIFFADEFCLRTMDMENQLGQSFQQSFSQPHLKFLWLLFDWSSSSRLQRKCVWLNAKGRNRSGRRWIASGSVIEWWERAKNRGTG